MKYLLFVFLPLFLILAGCTDLKDNKIYFFTKDGCPYCQKAENYISQNHPNVKIEYKDISKNTNYILFKKCAQKFKISKSHLGTPLICMGDDYILGWSEKSKEKFHKLIKNFNN